MLAVESIAGDDGGLEVILGLGVVLTFGGLLLRAVTGRFARSRAGTAVTAWLDAAAQPSAGPSGSSKREPVSLVAGRARELAVLAELCEPESRRLSEDCLAPLARTLDVSRRLRVADESVALALAGLPVEAWLVERNVLVGALRVPFLALGATGVFAICPTGGPCTPDELVLIDEAAERVRELLPGYDGRVHGAACLVLEDHEPRRWFGGEAQDGRGAWQLSLDWLLPWMFSFGSEHGLRSGDVRRLDEASGPSLHRGRTARLPTAPHRG
jgi:hypothetical protein